MIIIMYMDSHQTLNLDNEPSWLAIKPEEVLKHPPAPASSKRIRLWALTLDSRSIPCQIDKDMHGLSLLVPPENYDAAVYELGRFEELNRNWPPQAPEPRPLAENGLVTLSVLILLATFHNLSHLGPTSLSIPMPDWLKIGSSQSGLILDGQWWRVITSLTLHSNAVHLLGNLTIGGVFIYLLCRELGSGLAWNLILASGALGNLLNAFAQPSSHNSVGASTAVFGTVGILAAINQLRNRNYLRQRWPLPVAASLALLALLGSEGKQTDLGAHFFGLICGIAIGLVTEWLIARHGHPGRRLNILLALLSIMVMLAAWWMAISNAT